MGIRERQPARPDQRPVRSLALQLRHSRPAVLDRGGEVALPHGQAAGEQAQHGPTAHGLRQPAQPARHGLRRRARQHDAVPADGPGRGLVVPARQPVLDGVQRVAVGGQRHGGTPVQLGQLGRSPLLAETRPEEVAEERVKGIGLAQRADEQAGVLHLGAERLRQAERTLEIGIELVHDARVEQPPVQVRIQPVEDLLRQVLEDRVPASGRELLGARPGGRGEGHAQRPAFGGGEQAVHLAARGLLAAQKPQAVGALGG